MEKDGRHVCSGIEDLVFPLRRSRESGRAGLRVCIEHCYILTEMPGKKQQTILLFNGAML